MYSILRKMYCFNAMPVHAVFEWNAVKTLACLRFLNIDTKFSRNYSIFYCQYSQSITIVYGVIAFLCIYF